MCKKLSDKYLEGELQKEHNAAMDERERREAARVRSEENKLRAEARRQADLQVKKEKNFF